MQRATDEDRAALRAAREPLSIVGARALESRHLHVHRTGGLLDAALVADGAHVETLWVHPRARRAGLGSAIVRAWRARHGALRAYNVAADAEGFWRRAGLAPSADYDNVWADAQDGALPISA